MNPTEKNEMLALIDALAERDPQLKEAWDKVKARLGAAMLAGALEGKSSILPGKPLSRGGQPSSAHPQTLSDKEMRSFIPKPYTIISTARRLWDGMTMERARAINSVPSIVFFWLMHLKEAECASLYDAAIKAHKEKRLLTGGRWRHLSMTYYEAREFYKDRYGDQ